MIIIGIFMGYITNNIGNLGCLTFFGIHPNCLMGNMMFCSIGIEGTQFSSTDPYLELKLSIAFQIHVTGHRWISLAAVAVADTLRFGFLPGR